MIGVLVLLPWLLAPLWPTPISRTMYNVTLCSQRRWDRVKPGARRVLEKVRAPSAVDRRGQEGSLSCPSSVPSPRANNPFQNWGEVRLAEMIRGAHYVGGLGPSPRRCRWWGSPCTRSSGPKARERKRSTTVYAKLQGPKHNAGVGWSREALSARVLSHLPRACSPRAGRTCGSGLGFAASHAA
jgi:hypothetical protein